MVATSIAEAERLAARDSATVWHPYAPMPMSQPALAVVEATGTRLTLADGRVVIDAMSSWWAAIHGYRHPVLDDAVRLQLGRMAHVMFGGLTHAPAIELAELLVEITPPGLDHVFFADSGSVAVEVAMKMALQTWMGRGRPRRQRFVAVRNGYHGDTLGAMSVCDPETGMHHMFRGVLPQQLFAPAPTPDFHEVFDDSHLDAMQLLLEAHENEIAAVIIEPIVQGAGGMRFYAPEYLRSLRELCTRHDVLLIADEIATGFGRSGELFGCDHVAVRPDIMCVGKALTGGYVSMAATLCTTDVAHSVSRAESGALMHGPTFMGNPLAAAVALASVRLLLDQPWAREIARIERALITGLEATRLCVGVRDVRVLGAIGVIETESPLVMHDAQRVALEHGVWLRPFGRLLYTMPPYISTDADIAQICNAMSAVAGSLGS